jgi:vitamin B12 transporter
VRSDHWDVRGQATGLDPVNRTSGATSGKTLVRRARQSARLDFDRRFGLHSAGIAVIGEGRRYDDADNTVALAGYALVDLRAEYRIDRDWRIQGRAANVLDKPYETAAFYNQPGRSYFITLRYQPAK